MQLGEGAQAGGRCFQVVTGITVKLSGCRLFQNVITSGIVFLSQVTQALHSYHKWVIFFVIVLHGEKKLRIVQINASEANFLTGGLFYFRSGASCLLP